MVDKLKRPSMMKLDVGESEFFERQLEFIMSETYNTKYKEMKAFMLFPISNRAPSGTRKITYRVFSKIGNAKIIADYAKDFPRADITGEERTGNVRGIGNSYGYSIPEIRRARIGNYDLEQNRADAARRASDQKVNAIAFNGDSSHGLQGFINYPGISEYTIPDDGEGDSKLWSTKTPDQIVRDVMTLASSVVDATNEMEIVDTVLMSSERYHVLVNTRMTDGNDKNLLQYILENSPYIKQIVTVSQLRTAGAGGTQRMMAYPKNPKNVTLEIPQPFEQFEAEKEGMEYKIPCHQETGGVIIYYTQAVVYGDGI